MIYTTNAIEAWNWSSCARSSRPPGTSPTDEAAMKLIYLGIRSLACRYIDGTGLAIQRCERGTGTFGWKQAMNQF